ncbi:MAG: cytochrome c3 family protein [bacterium]
MNNSISNILCSLIAVLIAGLLSSSEKEPVQPIAYNHNKHVEEAGMECLDCHKYAEENARASIPNIEVCQDCHDEALSDSEAEKTLVAYIKNKKRIPWQQNYFVPDYAYFSHRRHVKLGKLDCAVCHGDVAKLTRPISQPFVKMKMDWCRDCHEQRKVSNDCYACHR